MCTIKDGFKLCTCADVSAEEADWVLIRHTAGDINVIMGSVTPEYFSFLKSQEWIATELNQRDCFDFDYAPRQGDRLIIKTREDSLSETVCFEYDDDYDWQLMILHDHAGFDILARGRVESTPPAPAMK